MRYVTAEFRRNGGPIHPWGATLTDDPAVGRGPMYELELLEDGTAKLLCRLYGDVERGYALTREHEYVVEVDTTDSDPGLLYVRIEIPPTHQRILAFPRKTTLVLTMPLKFTPDGATVATFVGDDAAFTDSLDVLPDPVSVELVESGAYDPSTGGVFDGLTARQQEILNAAMQLGYYNCPREATQADVAKAVGVSPGTVGEHLRKIEARTFNRLLGDKEAVTRR